VSPSEKTMSIHVAEHSSHRWWPWLHLQRTRGLYLYIKWGESTEKMKRKKRDGGRGGGRRRGQQSKGNILNEAVIFIK
jgi:hypothetical protein